MKKLLYLLPLLLSLAANAYSPPPNCPSSGGTQALNYLTATNAFSCNVVSGGGGGGDTITSPNSTISVGGTSSNTTLDVNLANPNSWSGLQTFGNHISLGGATLNVSSLASGNLLQYNGTNWANVTPASLGLGTVTTTGSPASGNLTKFSGSTSITNGDLSGDITTSGTLAATLATVNSNTGAFGSSTSIPNFSVNGKGLITAAGGNAVIAPAGTLSGTTLNSTVVSSSLTSVGTITTGIWTGTTIAIANGGTGQTSAGAAFNALSPLTTSGDVLYGGVSGAGTRLGANSTATNKYLQSVSSGVPAWAQVAFSDLSGSASAAQLPKATASTFGIVEPDNSTITISGGVISSVGGSGTVTTTGSPASGNLTKFSGSTSITNGDVSGDCTTSGTLAITCTKTNGSAFAASATTDTTNASNISSGTLASARGGAGSINGALKGNGSGVVSQAACADLSNGATGCLTATGTSGATIPLLNGANTWSGAQSFNSSDLVLKGATSGTITLNAAATAGSNTLTLPAGTTDFSATGGTSQVVKQTSSGGAFTVAQLACADLSNGATGCSTATGTSGATIPLLNGANTVSGVETHTAAIISTPVVIAISTSTFNTDASLGNNFRVVLVHASCPCTLSNPTNAVDGEKITYEIVQSSTPIGADIIGTYGTNFDFGVALSPTLSVGANKEDFIAFQYSSQNSKWNYLGAQQGM